MKACKADKVPYINRKLWLALANDQLLRRKGLIRRYAMPCASCLEILMCDGPIGVHICSTIKKMQKGGLIKGPKWIPFQRLRRKLLPISMDCLVAYGLAKLPERVSSADRELERKKRLAQEVNTLRRRDE